MASIVVVGSLNLDEIVAVDSWPEAGATVLGRLLGRYPGGKGANQAVAAAALGGDVAMVGRVGSDDAGRELVSALSRHGVDVRHVVTDQGTPTGEAFVTVAAGGDNRIIVLANANGRLRPADLVGVQWSTIRAVLLQLEVPMDVTIAAARAGRAAGATVVLDPAPACELPEELWGAVDVLIPNVSEAGFLSGLKVVDERSARLAAARLSGRGPHAVIVKLGPHGALLVEGNYVAHMPGVPVRAVDTTGAGDVFAGAIAVALAEGQPLGSAVQFANRAAAISTTKVGAQSSLPTREEVLALLDETSNVDLTAS